MTPEERFETIEKTLQVTAEGLLQTQALLKTVSESQVHAQQVVTEIAESMARYADSANARMSRVEDNIAHYVEAADARMRRIEENLDGLIRAITAEHTNGKQQQ